MNTSPATLDTRLADLLPPGEVFVDLGCGAGDALDALSHRFVRSIGIDASSARLGGRTQPVAGWEFIQADLDEALPFPDGSATAVLANQVIEHVLDPVHLLNEAHRIMRPGGVLVLTTPNVGYVRIAVQLVVGGRGPQTGNRESQNGPWDNGHIHYFTHRDLREMLTGIGYRRVHSRALIALGDGGPARRLADRFSDVPLVREFLSGNALFVAEK